MHDWFTNDLVFAALLTTSFVCVGLLSLWACISPRHWFVRVAVWLAAVSPLLLIPAYEPFIGCIVQGVTVAFGVSMYRWLARRRAPNSLVEPAQRPLRFSLSTALLVTVLTAIAVSVAIRLPQLNITAWTTVVFNSLSAGVATLVASWLFVARRKIIAWPIGFLICIVVGLAMSMFDWTFLSFTGSWIGWPPDSSSLNGAASLGIDIETWPVVEWLFIIPLTSLTIAAAIYLGRQVFDTSRSTNRNRSLAQFALVVVALLLAAFPVYVLAELLTPDPIPELIVPHPNAFLDYVEAGRIVDTTTQIGGTLDIETATRKQLVAEVAKCDEVYRLIDEALKKQCAAPVDYSFSHGDLPMEGMMYLRNAMRALAARGKLAEMQDRFADAAESYRKAVHVGYAVRRGGLIVHSFVGMGCTSAGTWSLYHVRDRLPAESLSKSIKLLVDLEAVEEPYEQVCQRDRVWIQRACGWHGHLQQLLGELTDDASGFFSDGDYTTIFANDRAAIRLLTTELALAQFRLESGHWPKSLAELAPRLLPAVPIDPLDPLARPLKYQLDSEADRYVLYSVGPNGIDDGGAFPAETDFANVPQSGDLRLDHHFAPDNSGANPTPGAVDPDESKETTKTANPPAE